jgi:hypothetical protein
MYKSAVVKLVFLNSVLAFSACARTCDPEEIKKDDQQLAENQQQHPRRRSCHGTAHGGGSRFIYLHGGGAGVRTGSRGGSRSGQSGSGSVGRGGFGATGSGTAS